MERLEQSEALNQALLAEMPEYWAQGERFPREEGAQRRLLRSLMNLRPPCPWTRTFWRPRTPFSPPRRRRRGWWTGRPWSPPRPTHASSSGRGTSPGCGRTPSSTRPTPPCWGASTPATGASTMPFLTQSHRGLPGQARSNAAALRISVGFDCP